MTTPTREQIQTNIWAQRLVLAVLNHYQDGDHEAAGDGVTKVFDDIDECEDSWMQLHRVAEVLASMHAEELAARQPVNAARNVAESIATALDRLSD